MLHLTLVQIYYLIDGWRVYPLNMYGFVNDALPVLGEEIIFGLIISSERCTVCTWALYSAQLDFLNMLTRVRVEYQRLL